MLNWIPAAQAPKDGTVIIGCFKDTHPDRLICVWDELDEEWVAAYPQVDISDGKENRYFENQHFHEDDLEVWAEL
jgi:hypothetical protein